MRAAPSRHALVVGGSGMLAGCCRRLAEADWTVTVVGRDAAKLAQAASGDARIATVSVDYERLAELESALDETVTRSGPIGLAVCWIRSWAPKSLRVSAAAVADGGLVLHVVGSSGSDASEAVASELCRSDRVSYRRVRLGAVIENGATRWLTDDEISLGVYAAIDSDAMTVLVGKLSASL